MKEAAEGIVCGWCGSTDWKVLDSRPMRGGYIYRRRECCICGERTATYEYAERDIKRARAVINALEAVENGRDE